MSFYEAPNPGFQQYGEGFAPSAPQQNFQPAPQPAGMSVAQAVAQPAPAGFSPAPATYEATQAPAPAPAPQPSYGGGGGGNGYGGGGSGYGGGNSYGGQRPNNGYGGGRPGGGGGRGGFQKPPLTQQQLDALRLPKMAVLTGNYNAQENIRPLVAEVVSMLKQAGYTIRVTAGKGFDDIAMQTAGQGAEIYLPCKFNDVQYTPHSTFNGDECKEFTRRHCPNFPAIPEKQQMWYYRNTRMVLGKNCTQPAQVSIIWSDDGVESPSTYGPKSGHAGHVAVLSRAQGIPVFNLNNPNAVQRLKQFLEG